MSAIVEAMGPRGTECFLVSRWQKTPDSWGFLLSGAEEAENAGSFDAKRFDVEPE